MYTSKQPFFIVLLIGLFFSCGSGGQEKGKGAHAVSTVALQETTTFIRKNINGLPASDPIISGYRAGIKAMKALPDTDPRSWTYQAAIHGTYTKGNKPAWNECQHGSFYFIMWHRMYLYYFERIVRKYSGDPAWALPYWNYSTDTTRQIPVMCRLPADATNELYVSQRNKAMNSGGKLTDQVVSLKCLSKIPFTGTASNLESFAGQTIPAPQHFYSGTGALENIPHNQIHNSVGGWMADPNTAAQDPIFWLHHSNIDRLWNTWIALGNGRANTSDPGWLSTKFDFFDENAKLVQLSGAQILHTVSQLGYKYDTDPETDAPALLAVAQTDPGREAKMNHEMQQPTKVLLAEKQGETRFTSEPLTVTLALNKNKHLLLQESLVDNDTIGKSTYLSLEGLTFDQLPAKSIGVFINLPKGTKPDYSSPHYINTITFFGLVHHHHGGEGVNLLFNIDSNLKALKEMGIDTRNISITFDLSDGVEAPPGFTEEKSGLLESPVGNPGFKRLSIQVF